MIYGNPRQPVSCSYDYRVSILSALDQRSDIDPLREEGNFLAGFDHYAWVDSFHARAIHEYRAKVEVACLQTFHRALEKAVEYNAQ